MAINYPGPYDIRIFYTVDGRDHVQKINCDIAVEPAVGSDFADIDLITRGGGSVQADTAVDAYIDIIDLLYADADTNFSRAELWKYPPLSFDSTYIAAYDIGVVGVNTNPTVPASEITVMFRTAEGGFMRLVYLDTAIAPGVSFTPPYVAGPIKTLTDFVVSSSNWMLARDTSYPIANLSWHPGQNEKLFREVYR